MTTISKACAAAVCRETGVRTAEFARELRFEFHAWFGVSSVHARLIMQFAEAISVRKRVPLPATLI